MNTQENPFLTRICFEEQFIENNLFSIVRDIDPIVDDHFLFYSKEVHRSIADSSYKEGIKLLNAFVDQIDRPYAYFERGRASFCTSMNGVQHGHGHLVPFFLDDLSELFPYGKIFRFDTIEAAYDTCAMADGQYLLWGNIGGSFFVIDHVEEMPKRTIRNTIRNICDHSI